MSDREFINPYQEYDGASNIFDITTNKLSCESESLLLKNVNNLLQILESRIPKELDWSDISVYTGTPGIAMMYMHFMEMEQCEGKKDFLKEAFSYIKPALQHLKDKRYTFLCGDTGPLAIAAVLYHKAGKSEKSKSLAERIERFWPVIESHSDPTSAHELLYGTVGYLYALLFLEKHIGEDKNRKRIIKSVVENVLECGRQNSAQKSRNVKMPLFYEWHDKAYVGSAHGFSGIMYMLLQAREFISREQMDKLVKPTIDYILNLQFPSGNFPSSLENSASDKLVHWCHGAPGVIHLMLLAYQIFKDDKYLKAAKACGDVIWQRGLLKKGYGLCHGAAGNGYAHLRLFQVTQDLMHLYRALKFAEWCFDYGKHGCRIADRPLSLFEGLAGTIYFILDLLDPMNSAFPAFQLNVH